MDQGTEAGLEHREEAVIPDHFKSLVAEAKELAESPKIKTEEARALLTLLRRLVETLAEGEPKTPKLPAHHV